VAASLKVASVPGDAVTMTRNTLQGFGTITLAALIPRAL